jgi:TPR repeat protein
VPIKTNKTKCLYLALLLIVGSVAIHYAGIQMEIEEGIITATDNGYALEILHKAAERGDPDAQYKYGDWLVANDNYTEAIKWFQKSAEQNNADGQYAVGLCLLQGYGAEPNPHEAVKWLRQSAEQGHDVAKLLLNACYKQGHGVDLD